MPNHKVEQGECLNSIAKANGFAVSTIWNHPQNAALKVKRKDPNILYPGDTVYIPDKDPKYEDRPTDKQHRFEVSGAKCKLRIRLLHDDKPRANEPYRLNIDGVWSDGQTDGDGWVENKIAPDAHQGKLVLQNSGDEYTLLLGHLDPISEVSGIQKRLQNLGFYIGEKADGIPGPRTASGVKAFQKKYGLAEDGIPGPITQAKLKEVYGC